MTKNFLKYSQTYILKIMFIYTCDDIEKFRKKSLMGLYIHFVIFGVEVINFKITISRKIFSCSCKISFFFTFILYKKMVSPIKTKKTIWRIICGFFEY